MNLSKNIDGLLSTLKFVHKIFVYVIMFICSSAEPTHEIRRM